MASNHPTRDPTLPHLTKEQVERIDHGTTSRPCAVEGCPCRETIVPLSLPEESSIAETGAASRSRPEENNTAETGAADEERSKIQRERTGIVNVLDHLLMDLSHTVSANLIKAWQEARSEAALTGAPGEQIPIAHQAPILCANPGCKKRGLSVCIKCTLVAYCCKQCQVQHWNRAEDPHKIHCQAPLAQREWKPKWESEDRLPNFEPITSLKISAHYIHPWGSFPAHDIACLPSNEGVSFKGDLSILFADAQDFRHAMKTILSLPSDFVGSLKITLNDSNFHLAARQILTLALFQIDDPAVVADILTHLWYSAFLRKEHIKLIERYLRPILGLVKVPTGAQKTDIVPMIFKLGKGKVHIHLQLRQWHQLATLLIRDLGDFSPMQPRFPPGAAHTVDHEQRAWQVDIKNRLHAALGPRHDPYKDQRDSRYKVMTRDVDSHDRAYSELRGKGQLHQRLSRQKFRSDGLLLPYGADRSQYTEFNPTLWYLGFHWRVSETADPLFAWSPKSVRDVFFPVSHMRALHNDVYGQLTVFLRGAIAETHVRIRNMPITFHVRTVKPADLPAALAGTHFDRLDLGDSAAPFRNGLAADLAAFAPLLNRANKHAAIITFITGLASDANFHDAQDTSAMFRSAAAFLHTPFFGVRAASADAHLYARARSLFAPAHAWLARRLGALRADDAAAAAGLARRRANRVVAMCPFAMCGGAGEAGAQQEFDDRMAVRGAVDGADCFVEWAAADSDAAVLASLAGLAVRDDEAAA